MKQILSTAAIACAALMGGGVFADEWETAKRNHGTATQGTSVVVEQLIPLKYVLNGNERFPKQMHRAVMLSRLGQVQQEKCLGLSGTFATQCTVTGVSVDTKMMDNYFRTVTHFKIDLNYDPGAIAPKTGGTWNIEGPGQDAELTVQSGLLAFRLGRYLENRCAEYLTKYQNCAIEDVRIEQGIKRGVNNRFVPGNYQIKARRAAYY